MATTLSLKLLVDGKSQKVVFAECGKDVIDFLFSLFILPLGSVVEVLTKEQMVGDIGAIGQLFKSVTDMNEAYILPGQAKVSILHPEVLSPLNKPFPLQLDNVAEKGKKKHYTCHRISICTYVTDVANTNCPKCNNVMGYEMPYVAARGDPKASASTEEGGFVKSAVTYMVTDDLKVTPLSPISAITLLNSFNIRDVGELEEKIVKVGTAEELALLKASLQSKTVLTDVFLGKSPEKSDEESRGLYSDKDERHVIPIGSAD